jgi:hypothetical protein
MFSLEIVNDRLFISDTLNDRIVSTALDGSDLQILVSGVEAEGISIFDQRLYYDNTAGDGRNIYSVPLGGGASRYEATTDRRSFQLTVIPEPSTFLLAALGVAMLVALHFRRGRPTPESHDR